MKKILYLLNTPDYQNSLLSVWKEYEVADLQSVKLFYQNLNSTFKKKIIFRIGQKSIYTGDIEQYYLALGDNIELDLSEIPFKRILNNYSLIIIGYESTAIYELLAKTKIPFLIFLPNRYFNCFAKKAKKDFLILKKNKILFFSEKKLSEEINKNYYKIISSWKKKMQIKKIIYFKEKYAKYERFKFLKLKKILNEICNKFYLNK